VTAG